MPLINYVTRVQFGFWSSVATLKEELALAGISRPLVVTDKGVRGLGFSTRLKPSSARSWQASTTRPRQPE